ncbi:hypothetical protein BT63DRAFT_151312 [Microthyrium microscopicum]|uniref:Uncharacterized protein n=1 Tax=Microthyrium microscopicum TaxID=703497 RepID=A0A6A6ULY1_9PEZI|nr:hypothetical protein BT63DRAFT_151312 [Microthyrium microscopicum]
MAVVGQSSFIPLTTTFTPPSTCTETLTLVLFASSKSGTVTLPSTSISTSISGFLSDCYPSDLPIIEYYSPGICPKGYTRFSETTRTTSLDNRELAETAALCCPNGYTGQSQATGFPTAHELCSSTVNNIENATVIEMFDVNNDLTSNIPDSIHFTPYPSSISQGTVTASGIQVRWKSDDFNTTSTTSSSVSTAPIATTSSSGSTSPTLVDGSRPCLITAATAFLTTFLVSIL